MAREGRDEPPASINNLHGKHPISPAPHTAALHMHLPLLPLACALQPAMPDRQTRQHTYPHTYMHALSIQHSHTFGANTIPRPLDWLLQLDRSRHTHRQTERYIPKGQKKREREGIKYTTRNEELLKYTWTTLAIEFQ